MRLNAVERRLGVVAKSSDLALAKRMRGYMLDLRKSLDLNVKENPVQTHVIQKVFQHLFGQHCVLLGCPEGAKEPLPGVCSVCRGIL